MFLHLGIGHIIDFRGYDHILFIVALSAIFLLKDWRKVLVLVTAFTIGHSTTLALATLKIIKYSTALIEFLIPVTIFITALGDFFYKGNEFSKSMIRFKYFSALFFGLIHGMGFSNYLRALLGGESSIVLPLFAFNIGLEIGQIIIVLSFLAITSFLVQYFKIVRRDLTLISAGAAFGVSIILITERFSAIFQ